MTIIYRGATYRTGWDQYMYSFCHICILYTIILNEMRMNDVTLICCIICVAIVRIGICTSDIVMGAGIVYCTRNIFWNVQAYSTNHVYLHRPNAFGFWQNAFAPVLRNTQTHFKLFWIGLRIRNAFGMDRNCTFCVCLFSQILICDLWALGGFSFGFGFSFRNRWSNPFER